MNERQKSIAKLKEGVKSRAFGCYKGANNCLYYDPKTDSKCAVGYLVDNEYFNKMVKNKEAVSEFLPELEDYDGFGRFSLDGPVAEHLSHYELDEMFGLNRKELQTLQDLHDACINKRGYTLKVNQKELENYINNLKGA